jgi:hypothetical protein
MVARLGGTHWRDVIEQLYHNCFNYNSADLNSDIGKKCSLEIVKLLFERRFCDK